MEVDPLLISNDVLHPVPIAIEVEGPLVSVLPEEIGHNCISRRTALIPELPNVLDRP